MRGSGSASTRVHYFRRLLGSERVTKKKSSNQPTDVYTPVEPV